MNSSPTIASVSSGVVKLWQNEYVLLAVRIVLGFVFVLASIEKIADPNAFATSIGYYKLIGPSAAMAIAMVLPWVELIAGVFLIFGVLMRGSSLLIFLMLVLFTAGVLSGIARGLDISCGCFSRDPNVDKIGWLKVLENSGLIALSILSYFSRPVRFILTQSQTVDHETSSEISRVHPNG